MLLASVRQHAIRRPVALFRERDHVGREMGQKRMDAATAELLRAFFLWLPGATVAPFVVSRLTGADSRLAGIESAIFALCGLLIYPTLLGLLSARFVAWEAGAAPVELLFAGGFVLAAFTLVAIRRARHRIKQGSHTRRWTHFR